MVLIELGIKYKHIGHQHKLDTMVALGWLELGHKDILSEIPRGKFFAGLVQNAKFPISLIDVMHKCGRAAQGWFKERERELFLSSFPLSAFTCHIFPFYNNKSRKTISLVLLCSMTKCKLLCDQRVMCPRWVAVSTTTENSLALFSFQNIYVIRNNNEQKIYILGFW